MDHLSATLVAKSLNFHGQPLFSIWQGERGDNDLMRIGLISPDFSTYQARQKNLAFQDRAKRLKLHQFIAKKANALFDASLHEEVPPNSNFQNDGSYAKMPPYEVFINLDKNDRQRHFFDHVQTGDIVYGTIVSKSTAGMIIKVLCSTGTYSRFVADMNVKAYLPISNTIPAVDKKNVTRVFSQNDNVCCEIVEVSPDSDRMVVTMISSKPNDSSKTVLGLVHSDNFPEVYKTSIDLRNETYNSLLEKSQGFDNPYFVETLSKELGLDPNEHYTNMSGLRGRFNQTDYSNELRQIQASKWAFRSVAEGIEHFKEGRHSEAFQCLNKALNIDPRNVEGLVARGALYANSGSFKKAVEDFETALKLNPSHANARKYMGETLVALGRSYEDENKLDDAKKAYQDCLDIIPRHEEAQNSLEFLKSKLNMGSKQLIDTSELMLPALNLNKSMDSKLDSSSSVKKDSDSKKDKKSKKKKAKGRKRKNNSSSSSSSESSESSESSSESSSSTDSSTSSDSDSKKKRSKSAKKPPREKSLSPLSKRMALMGDHNQPMMSEIPNQFQFNQNHPYAEPSGSGHQFHHQQQMQHLIPPPPQIQHQMMQPDPGNDEYENKVRKFLEITRDEEDYEEKVRKFVEEASKYRKERKALEEKNKKKKKKEAKKLKKDSKKKKKEKEREEKKKAKLSKNKLDLDSLDNKKIREALKIFENLPVLDELGSKLSSLMEKNASNTFTNSYDTEKLLARYKSPDKYHPSTDTGGGSKWKMEFARDESKLLSMRNKKEIAGPSSKVVPKQYIFANDSDDSDDDRKKPVVVHPPPPPPPTEKSKRRGQTPSASKYKSSMDYNNKSEKEAQQMKQTAVKSGPVVLDKFGNFRLASMDTAGLAKPPEPPNSPRKVSRSRSRGRKYSKSSSRSRSRGRRSRSGSYVRKYSRSRSRSRSFRSRSRSRSHSRSYSRSRSRSRSVRRNDRRNSSRRGGHGERGTYYKPRFPRARGRGTFSRDFREFRGRDRARPYRPRQRGGSSRFYRNYREDSRERRFSSRERSGDERRSFSNERPPRSPVGETENKGTPPVVFVKEGVHSVDIEGRWADDKINRSNNDDKSLEDIEKLITKAKKENKEDMIERNKDLVKKNVNYKFLD